MLETGKWRRVHILNTKKSLSRLLFGLCSQNFDSQFYAFQAGEQKILFSGNLNNSKET